MEDEPIPTFDHLANDFSVARLVRVPETTGGKGGKQECTAQEKQEQWREVTSLKEAETSLQEAENVTRAGRTGLVVSSPDGSGAREPPDEESLE